MGVTIALRLQNKKIATYCRGIQWGTRRGRGDSAATGTAGSYREVASLGCAGEPDAAGMAGQLGHVRGPPLGTVPRGSAGCGRPGPFPGCA